MAFFTCSASAGQCILIVVLVLVVAGVTKSKNAHFRLIDESGNGHYLGYYDEQ